MHQHQPRYHSDSPQTTAYRLGEGILWARQHLLGRHNLPHLKLPVVVFSVEVIPIPDQRRLDLRRHHLAHPALPHPRHHSAIISNSSPLEEVSRIHRPCHHLEEVYHRRHRPMDLVVGQPGELASVEWHHLITITAIIIMVMVMVGTMLTLDRHASFSPEEHVATVPIAIFHMPPPRPTPTVIRIQVTKTLPLEEAATITIRSVDRVDELQHHYSVTNGSNDSKKVLTRTVCHRRCTLLVPLDDELSASLSP